ncbi:MAG: carboxymuconolactone decarboxylase family protein [Nitrospirota bacterium]|nr:carboxymuconolactone decarboxylase family protein [Nitrospirota bacterium]MDH5587405.1 carboxymuconolactone decarboxylase family protein [Nitrospirota bacterium]MDH5776300.1 carboxymuconolactone decarboxylase family protein [Nitrospirota bacterium]
MYAQVETEFGFVPNLLKVLGHSGPVTQAMGAVLDTLFHHLSLTPRIQEIAYLTVAQSNQCAYCVGHHLFFAKQAGMTEDEIVLLGESGLTNAGFSDGERAVIRFALETTKDVAASDDAHVELQKVFPLNRVVEIAFVVATANFIQRLGKNFRIELERPKI